MSRAAALKELFAAVDLPEVAGFDFAMRSPAEVAGLLPAYGGKHPTKAILVDRATGKAYGIASGWEPETVTHAGVPFRSGAISPEVAAQAGQAWRVLGNHVEAVAAAFARKSGIVELVVYINGRNPCWGSRTDPGCYWRLPEFLAEDSSMTVYNKDGADRTSSWPDRLFHFTGTPD